MYTLVLFAHSWTRWLVLGSVVGSLFRGVAGLWTRREWTPVDRRWLVAFVAALDTQVLLGLLLYFIFSPITPKSMADLRAFMPIGALRFFAVEHITMMVLALIVAHVSSVLCKRARDSRSRHRRLAWGAGLTLVILFAAIPWPWMPAARPLARWF